MKVKFIGTASGIATHDRYHCSVALDDGDRVVLLDCGEPAAATLLRSGIPLARIEKIFVSHMHSDHVAGLFQLIQDMQIQQRKAPLEVFVPEEGVDAVSRFLEAVYLFPEALPFKLVISPVAARIVLVEAGLIVQGFGNRHLAGLAELAKRCGYPNQGESLSFRIKMQGKVIVYSGDVKDAGELEEPLASETDLLIAELAHIESKELFQMLEGRCIGKVALTHIHPDRNDEEAMILEECPESLRGRLIMARDGMEFEI